MVDKIEGIERIRYMTSHPRDLTDKVIETIKIANISVNISTYQFNMVQTKCSKL